MIIKLAEENQLQELLDYCKGGALGCRIAAAAIAYGTSRSFAPFWFMYDDDGKIIGIINKLDDGITLFSKDSYDFESVDTFVGMMNDTSRFTRPVRPGEAATGLIMRLAEPVNNFESGANVQINPNIEDLYSVMEICDASGFEIPSFEGFYGDMLYRTKSGSVISAIVRDGEEAVACVAAHLSDDSALLTICACAPKYRGKGFASYAIRSILTKLGDRQVYTTCFMGLEEFYQKLGFVTVGGFVC